MQSYLYKVYKWGKEKIMPPIFQVQKQNGMKKYTSISSGRENLRGKQFLN